MRGERTEGSTPSASANVKGARTVGQIRMLFGGDFYFDKDKDRPWKAMWPHNFGVSMLHQWQFIVRPVDR